VRRAARVDANHAEIVEALRLAGCSVLSIAALGCGAPDLLVGKDGRNILMEVKDGSKPRSGRRLTEDEAAFHHSWRGQICVVESAWEALSCMRSL
jgi:Holliday junction resolvase